VIAMPLALFLGRIDCSPLSSVYAKKHYNANNFHMHCMVRCSPRDFPHFFARDGNTVRKCCCFQLRMMCQFSNELSVDVLPPYTPSKEELASPALYAANIRKLMVRDGGEGGAGEAGGGWGADCE
jgi:hypothetical protein